MTKLSVNINKVATLRNARGGDTPKVVKVALDCEAFGADGITVHPRPDERHIRRADVYLSLIHSFYFVVVAAQSLRQEIFETRAVQCATHTDDAVLRQAQSFQWPVVGIHYLTGQ